MRRCWSRATVGTIGLVLAKREFESGCLAAMESLRGVRGVAQDAVALDAADRRGAKERLSSHLADVHSPAVDQAAPAAELDSATARRAPSFAKFVRESERWLA